MKKLLILLALVAISLSKLYSQQLPLYSQYMLNGFLLNPGMAGSVDYIPVRLTVRQQWVGIKNAPSTQALSGHMLLNNQKIGVGGYIFNDKFGAVTRTGIQGAFAYHMPITNDTKLGLGLSFTAFQYKLDETNLNLIDENDPTISESIQSTFIPDANFGVYLYNEKYFAGIAAHHLIQYKIKLGDNTTSSSRMIRHYFATAGYKFDVGGDFQVEPSFLFKGTEVTPMQMDINLKAYYKKNYWLGVSYRTDKSIIALLGVKYDKYFLGYAFDYTMSNIKNYESGSHEIMFGVNFGEGANKGSSLL